MLIQLNTPIAAPAVTLDGVWILSIQINSGKTAAAPISAYVRVCPYCSADGTIRSDLQKTITIPDITAAAKNSLPLTSAMDSLSSYVQGYVNDTNLFA